MGVELDFTGLNGIAFTDNAPEPHRNAPQEPQEEDRVVIPPELAKAHTEPYRSPQGQTAKTNEYKEEKIEGVALVKLTRQQEEHEQNSQIYKAYQENIKHSSQIQTEILKGLKAGEAIPALLLKACKAISLMTDNSVFYKTAEETLKTKYGEELLEPAPISWELKSVRERLEKLEKALALEALNPEADIGAIERMKKAIEAHKAREAELERLLSIAERIS